MSTSCSGVRFFAFVAGLGGGYGCGTRPVRWLALLPLSYLIALFGNAARISMAWQFRRFSGGRIPEWLHEYVHMGIGIVCFLTIVAVLLYWILPQPRQEKETTPFLAVENTAQYKALENAEKTSLKSHGALAFDEFEEKGMGKPVDSPEPNPILLLFLVAPFLFWIQKKKSPSGGIQSPKGRPWGMRFRRRTATHCLTAPNEKYDNFGVSMPDMSDLSGMALSNETPLKLY